jgi:hypothetical protein
MKIITRRESGVLFLSRNSNKCFYVYTAICFVAKRTFKASFFLNLSQQVKIKAAKNDLFLYNNRQLLSIESKQAKKKP